MRQQAAPDGPGSGRRVLPPTALLSVGPVRRVVLNRAHEGELHEPVGQVEQRVATGDVTDDVPCAGLGTIDHMVRDIGAAAQGADTADIVSYLCGGPWPRRWATTSAAP